MNTPDYEVCNLINIKEFVAKAFFFSVLKIMKDNSSKIINIFTADWLANQNVTSEITCKKWLHSYFIEIMK